VSNGEYRFVAIDLPFLDNRFSFVDADFILDVARATRQLSTTRALEELARIGMADQMLRGGRRAGRYT
jgi:hypothetical protein